MSFVLEQQFIDDNKLSPEQVTAVVENASTHIAEQQKAWDGKANENAEKIIQGAADKVAEVTGIAREQGQKVADYLTLAGTSYAKGVKESYETKLKELEDKGGFDTKVKEELDALKLKYDSSLKDLAEFAEWKENDYKGKYETVSNEMSETKLKIAFTDSKPKFADGVNEWEAKGKWNTFVSSVKEKYTIELDKETGEAIAIDKNNIHSIKKLKDLVAADEGVKSLVDGRQIKGLGGGDKTKVTIDGVPFQVPEKATPQERSAAIRTYLKDEKKMSVTHPEYAKLFQEYNTKLIKQEKA